MRSFCSDMVSFSGASGPLVGIDKERPNGRLVNRWCISMIFGLIGLVAPTFAFATPVSITIDGSTFSAQNSISLSGLSPLVQPSGFPSTLTVIDTPTVKALDMTNFSLVGPDANRHLVTVQTTFSGLPFNAVGVPSASMNGTYAPALPFVLGGILDVNGFINGTRLAGSVTDLNLPTPLTFPNATDLIYEPANDIRVVLNPAQHSCDTETLPPAFNPNLFSCVLSGTPIFIPAQTPITALFNIDTTFAAPGDAFTFPGSFGVDIAVSSVPEPSTLILFGAGVGLLGACRRAAGWRRRASKNRAQRLSNAADSAAT